MLQVKKLKEHVYQKILKLDDTSSNTNTQFVNNNFNNSNENNSNISSTNNQNSSQSNNIGINNSNNQLNSNNEISNGANTTDLSANANRTIELICSDQVNFILSLFH